MNYRDGRPDRTRVVNKSSRKILYKKERDQHQRIESSSQPNSLGGLYVGFENNCSAGANRRGTTLLATKGKGTGLFKMRKRGSKINEVKMVWAHKNEFQ